MMADWIKEWAIVISAGATFILALAAFWAIWQTRGIQKTEKRERLLNEIIEWAMDIAESGAKRSVGIPDKITPEIIMQDYNLYNLIHKYDNVLRRTQYSAEIALVFGKDFHSAVARLSQMILDTAKRITEYFDGEITKEQLSKSEWALWECAIDLIGIVSQMKARGIG